RDHVSLDAISESHSSRGTGVQVPCASNARAPDLPSHQVRESLRIAEQPLSIRITQNDTPGTQWISGTIDVVRAVDSHTPERLPPRFHPDSSLFGCCER